METTCWALKWEFMAGYDKGFAEGYAKGYAEGYAKGYAEGYAKGYAEGYAKGYAEGYAKGYAEGLEIVEARLNRLVEILQESGRDEDIIKMATDPDFRQALYEQYGLTLEATEPTNPRTNPPSRQRTYPESPAL